MADNFIASLAFKHTVKNEITEKAIILSGDKDYFRYYYDKDDEKEYEFIKN